MSHENSRSSRHKHGAEAIKWLQEYLNAGAGLSELVLDEQCQIRLSAYREIDGSGEVSNYNHKAHVSLLGAELLRIDIVGETFGTISSAVFHEGDKNRVEISLAAGGFSIEFEALQVSELLMPVYEIKR